MITPVPPRSELYDHQKREEKKKLARARPASGAGGRVFGLGRDSSTSGKDGSL